MTTQPGTQAAGAPVGDGPTIGYLGPAGTFSEVAAERLTGAWPGERLAIESIINVIQSVSAAGLAGVPRLDAAVVPIENSTEGSVGATLDTLVEHDDLVITAELDLPIEQLLVARTELALDEIQQIYSHPQGIAQARRFLAQHVPQAGIVPVSSTSRSVELIADSTEPWAAIGSRRAAELYDAVILRDDIQELVNVTRFVLIERRDAPIARQAFDAGIDDQGGAEGAVAGDDAAGTESQRRRADDEQPMKTTLVFQGTGDGSPGWLVRCLSEFAFRGVNLTKIESRPMRGQLGHYRFFIDLEGSTASDDVVAAIDGLAHHCSAVRILGSYPVAADPV